MDGAEDPLLLLARQQGLLPAGVAPEPAQRAALARRVAAGLGLACVSLGGRSIGGELTRGVPADFARRHDLIPIERAGGRLVVAMADPLAFAVVDQLRQSAGEPVVVVLGLREEIRAALATVYGSENPDTIARDTPRVAAAGAAAEEATVAGWVDRILREAVQQGASDVHVEPLARRLRIRCRVDGELHEIEGPPKDWELPLVSRLKIMADLSIAEKRLPQDGRARFQCAGREVDLRVASVPTVHGESVVMRLLDPAQLRVGLGELGLGADDRAAMSAFLRAADGLVLVTGPTGSGKTTTLYAGLAELNQPERKIITVEDPIEYQLPGINQVAVNPAAGLTFAAALRALLRQAPNVVMVGEIRDAETANIAVNAALTGHLVLSTLHTNDAPSAVTRLLDLGVKPYLLANALRGIVAQRLVRRVCPACSASAPPTIAAWRALAGIVPPAADATVMSARGCPRCRHQGYAGRLGLFEVLPVEATLRTAIYDNVTAVRLRQLAGSAGMNSMRADGMRKVLAGWTTIEEVVSATPADLACPSPTPLPA